MQPTSEKDSGCDVTNGKMSVDEPPNLQLIFVDNEHQASMLQSLNMMRKNKHFCDVILHVGNAEIHAHRCVLASASPYLLELFTTDQDNNQRKSENVITYKLNGGFDKAALQRLVDYAYTSCLEVPDHQVRTVYLVARQLKMHRVTNECVRHLIKNLNVENCLDIRSLPGITKNREFAAQVDEFIASHFDVLSKSNMLLSLTCVQIEILNQTRQEMSLGNPQSLCHLVLDWIKRQIGNETLNLISIYEKTHMLYMALDNSLQDCSDLPSEDVSNTDIVRDYKKLSLKNTPSGQKSKRKCLGQPSKPRVLIYSRDINVENAEQEFDKDWNLIASTVVAEHTFLALVTILGRLTTMSVQLRLNLPITCSATNSGNQSQHSSGSQTPPECCFIEQNGNGHKYNTVALSTLFDSEKNDDEEEPDLYCALSAMTFGKCALGSANLKDGLLVCGGYDRTECLKTVERYIPKTNTWETLPNMRESRGRFEIAVIKNKVYALGGSNGQTELNSVEVLDFDQDTLKWQKSKPMPLARSNLGVCVLNETVYCIGGWNGQAGIKQCDVFDPETSLWSTIAPLNTGRHQAGVTTYNNFVYAVGGTDGWNCLNSVEKYDPDKNIWTFVKPLTTPRRGCGVVVFNDKLYAIGGSDGTHSLETTEILDTITNTWIAGPSMTTPRANVAVSVVDNKLYAIGGFSGKTFLNTMEYLDECSNEWTTFIPKTAEIDEVFNNLKNVSSKIEHTKCSLKQHELEYITDYSKLKIDETKKIENGTSKINTKSASDN